MIKLPAPEKKNLLLTGMAGLGKTYLCNAIAYRALSHGVEARIITAYSFIQAVLDGIRTKTGGVPEFCLRVPLLIIDDLGSESVIPNISEEALFSVLNERIHQGKPTVIATNTTMVITMKVTDQDPLICATMADSVKTRLQNFITDYRTSKARVDLDYNKKLYGEVKAKYEQARERFATFADSHRGISSQEARTRLSDLQTEMQLRQNIYQQVVAQLQQAEMKVQEETPAFTTLQSATVPIKKSGPARAKICLIFVFLAFLGTTAWVFHKEGDLKPLLGLS